MDWIKIFESYGIPGLVIGALFFFLWRMLIWVMKWVDKQEEHHREERKCWQVTIEGYNKALDDHTKRAQNFYEVVNEAHKFQRSEHGEMIQILARINGIKKD